MRTSDLFGQKRVFSFEIFPPKRDAPVDAIFKTLDGLSDLNPDFISVTYGAGGSENNAATLDIARAIKNDYGIESVAHMPCINLDKQDVLMLLAKLKEANVENVLALRGDKTPGIEPKKDFKYASDLAAFIRENSDFNIIGACYPETHPEASSPEADLRNLKVKVDAGVSQLTSQLFFDNADFFAFVDRARAIGIDVPIEAGIMPVMNKGQIVRMTSLCGASIPAKMSTILARHGDDNDSMLKAGIEYASEQIDDLFAQGVDGVHLYTMNNPAVARQIIANLSI